MYPTNNVTVVITDWMDNPMVRGSFLYLSIEQNYNDYWLLAAPVGNLFVENPRLLTSLGMFMGLTLQE